MAKIKYIDADGEHSGSLSGAEYYIYSTDKETGLTPTDRIPYFSWDNTDYAPFKRAVERKYNTQCEKAWITTR